MSDTDLKKLNAKSKELLGTKEEEQKKTEKEQFFHFLFFRDRINDKLKNDE